MESRREKLAEDERQTIVTAIGVTMVVAGAAMLMALTLVLACCLSLVLTLVLSLGLMRDGEVGLFRPIITISLVVWTVGLGLMHGLPAGVGAMFGGLPQASAVAIYLLWPAPVLLLLLPYGLLFRVAVVSDEELAHIEQLSLAERPT